MHVLVTIQHPAHVHFYRHVVDELEADGHEVSVYARENDVAVDLLQAYDVPHEVLAAEPNSTPGMIAMQLGYELRLWREARRLQPDVMTAIGGVAVSHVATLVGARSVVFVDNEGVASHRLVQPFADEIHTPRRFDGDLGGNHVRYDGFHELAYLGPGRFEPDPEPLLAAGVDPDERYFVLRFVDWSAQHDAGHHGLSGAAREELCRSLATFGRVFVSAEGDVDVPIDEFDRVEPIPVDPADVHHLLAHADCYVGDSATMATEAGLIGTPAVRSNSFVGDEEMSNFRELGEYGLVESYADEREALDRVHELVSNPSAGEIWDRRRRALLADKIDVTAYVRAVLVGEVEAPPDPPAAPAAPAGEPEMIRENSG